MKIQHKTSLLIFMSGIVSFVLCTFVYTYVQRKSEIASAKHMSSLQINEAADNLQTHIEEQIAIAKTLANSWTLKRELIKSNESLGAIDAREREAFLKSLNDRWMATKDLNDSFVQSYMTSTAADVLKEHVQTFQDVIGEAFITDAYGKVIGTTNKLTTLTHAHKYWWIEGFNNAQGKVFIDDRGFDDSVGGYVLGIVVPVLDKGTAIGVLKINVNIVETMRHVTAKYEKANADHILIVRSLGKIVFESGHEPLSTSIDKRIVEQFKKSPNGNISLKSEGREFLYTFYMMPLSKGSNEIGFGGTSKSIDHRGGNVGEGWYVVIVRDYEDILARVKKTNTLIFISGVFISLFMGLLALFIGEAFSKPIVIISNAAKKIGEGDFTTRVDMHNNDEIGTLASDLNKMASNLSAITSSRDELNIAVNDKDMLIREVHHRIKNNLAVIQNLLSLQVLDVEDNKSKNYFADAEGRIRSMTLIHEMLHNADDVRNISTSVYIEKLLETLFYSYNLQTDRIKLSLNLQDISLDVDTIVPLGLIINELTSNALKYAFPDERKGELIVSLKAIDNASYELVIKDTGIGLPDGLDFKKAKSLGLKIVQILVKQIKGTMSVSNNDGAEFKIIFSERVLD